MFGASWHRQGVETPVIQRFDVATGALLAERQVTPAGFNGSLWTYNPATGHLYAGSRGAIVVLDANTLQEVGRIPSPHPSLPRVDGPRPGSARSVRRLVWNDRQPKPGAGVPRAHRNVCHDRVIDIPIVGAFVGMALGPRPPRVSDLGALVAGRLVTLSWAIDASRSIATEQVVEVGFVPGQTVVRLPVAADASSLAVAGAPPGRYYVRIRIHERHGSWCPVERGDSRRAVKGSLP